MKVWGAVNWGWDFEGNFAAHLTEKRQVLFKNKSPLQPRVTLNSKVEIESIRMMMMKPFSNLIPARKISCHGSQPLSASLKSPSLLLQTLKGGKREGSQIGSTFRPKGLANFLIVVVLVIGEDDFSACCIMCSAAVKTLGTARQTNENSL